MGRALRNFAAARYWFITDRCHEERFLLRPDPQTNALVITAIVEAAAFSGVGILALCVMGNHWHMVLRIGVDCTSIPLFMQRAKSNVARALNSHRGRQGIFWGERYHAIPIVDESAVLERILYTLMNPVAAGLVSRAREYPGLSSLEATTDVRPACGRTRIPIELPPQWLDLSKSQLAAQRAALREELARRESVFRDERREAGLLRPKPGDCVRCDPFARPPRPARRPAPLCFAITSRARRAFRDARRAFVAAYRAASRSFREGALDAPFPCGAFPPRLLRPPVVEGQVA